MTPFPSFVSVDIDSAPQAVGRNGPRRDRTELVRRLRRQGWSYRRISAEIGIPYREVSLVLDAPDIPVSSEPVRLPTAPPRPASVARPNRKPPQPVATAAPSTAALSPTVLSPAVLSEDGVRALHQKLDQVLKASDEQRRTIERLSQEIAAVRGEQQAMGRRLQDLFSALWQRLIGRRRSSEQETVP